MNAGYPANKESGVLTLLDYAGVVVFAAAGALAASRKQLDIIGFLFFAAVTGVGGGTLRDLILGRLPVFWVKEPIYILVCVATGILVFFTAQFVEWRYKLLLWLDAIGLAAYSVMGALIGLETTGSPIIAIVTGMLTATCGGVLRDILADEPSVLLRPEIYITAALAGAGAFVLCHAQGVPLYLSAAAGFAVAFALRGGALYYSWTIPRYRPRPGRDPDDALK
ncbi:putative membrane protein YeiH [Neorhizobium huautlense]|uniref:Membrane protein YeiH n=1 Tax=Neorhizobium huautlense TaxID=67774 RepID=A0ABT9PP09_9HYPH|nr:trimeric intracellular cation channel family protein [Neorhizobium huautlense]MDP9835609.1 putative membrane protein YeiH [Neorhizobium huautlense]